MSSNAIRFSIVQTPLGEALGNLLVAASPRGVCFLCFGAKARELVDGLRAEFPYAVIERDDAGLAAWCAEIAAYASGAAELPDLPLDVRGSRFQKRVWAALQQIPRGETRSYSALAAALGRPTGARAVAGACAANPVAVLIPCHRVISKDGSLGGYRWGIGHKRELLNRERPRPAAR